MINPGVQNSYPSCFAFDFFIVLTFLSSFIFNFDAFHFLQLVFFLSSFRLCFVHFFCPIQELFISLPFLLYIHHIIYSPTDTVRSHMKPSPVLKAYQLDLRVSGWLSCNWCVHPVPGVPTYHAQYIACYIDVLPQMWAARNSTNSASGTNTSVYWLIPLTLCRRSADRFI